MNISEKIDKVKQLGGYITLRSPGEEAFFPHPLQVVIYLDRSDEEIHRALDRKIDLLTSRPWITTAEKKLSKVSICETCKFYKFKLIPKPHSVIGETVFQETCTHSYSRFTQVMKKYHEVITNCVDYTNHKNN
jgi:hypothetical protein